MNSSSDLQRQITREQLALSLMRLDSFITIERMEVGRVQARGDFAVVNTTIYGKLKKPVAINGEEVSEGRVSAQQFLYREGGQWRSPPTAERNPISSNATPNSVNSFSSPSRGSSLNRMTSGRPWAGR